MNEMRLSDAIGSIDEELCLEAQQVRTKKRKPRWLAWVAVAACIAIAVALAKPLLKQSVSEESFPLGKNHQTFLQAPDKTTLDFLIAAAKYPEMAQFPTDCDDWDRYIEALNIAYESRYEIRAMAQEPKNAQYFNDFYKTSSIEYLAAANNENIVYSPSNAYMALAMLAELTDGESRGQILSLLSAQSIEELRIQAKYLWISNYSDDGVLTTRMANSVWLADDLPYEQETLKLLADEYYASSYHGTMGSETYNTVLREWMNEQTDGLLEDNVASLGFDKDTVLALASTIYFKGRWTDGFNPANECTKIFHSAIGDVETEFMRDDTEGVYFWGENFSAIEKPMEQGASMWLILPDEGKTVQDVLCEGEIFEMTAAGAQWENCKDVQLHLEMPKFDVTSSIELTKGLKNLGIRDVFEPSVSDFTPMSKELKELFVSSAQHTGRVMVDEEGCEAAAYTILITEATGAVVEDEVDFVLDRPFVFVITGAGDQPLFIGVVNQIG